MTRVFVPCDSAAVSVGADEVAFALEAQIAARGLDAQIVRNGSRGMFWLEPLVEVEVAGARIAFGPLRADDIATFLDCGGLDGSSRHPAYLGPTHEIPYLAAQRRITFARVGVVDPLSFEDYARSGGIAALRRALTLSPHQIVEEVTASGLRGRGGAAFPTGIKWRTVLEAPAGEGDKYIVCNADEGDSGTFADRMLMEGDPFALLEGMTIAALAVGATGGYIYLREEYRHAQRILGHALATARAEGLLGADVLGSGRAFDVALRLGAGSYICGEETAMLESLEGKRGMVRAKPPLPAVAGLFGQPTVVNNVVTLASVVPVLAAGGAQAYQALGTGRSRGSMTFQLAGNLRRPGLVELPFGAPLRRLLDEFGGGSASGRPLRAVQVGGPLGAYLPEPLWDTPLDYEAFAAVDGVLGHGGVVAFDDRVDMLAQARFAMAFCAEESCGKCTPCRIGSVRGVETIDRIAAGETRATELLLDLCRTMEEGSLCAMGGMTPYPVRSAFEHFSGDFRQATAGNDHG